MAEACDGFTELRAAAMALTVRASDIIHASKRQTVPPLFAKEGAHLRPRAAGSLLDRLIGKAEGERQRD